MLKGMTDQYWFASGCLVRQDNLILQHSKKNLILKSEDFSHWAATVNLLGTILKISIIN